MQFACARRDYSDQDLWEDQVVQAVVDPKVEALEAGLRDFKLLGGRASGNEDWARALLQLPVHRSTDVHVAINEMIELYIRDGSTPRFSYNLGREYKELYEQLVNAYVAKTESYVPTHAADLRERGAAAEIGADPKSKGDSERGGSGITWGPEAYGWGWEGPGGQPDGGGGGELSFSLGPPALDSAAAAELGGESLINRSLFGDVEIKRDFIDHLAFL
jgi:hypothetical protein